MDKNPLSFSLIASFYKNEKKIIIKLQMDYIAIM